jgi:hypothetical protein
VKIEEIKIGDTYQLFFTPKVSQVQITLSPGPNKQAIMTPGFFNSYGNTSWGDYQNHRVVIIDKTSHFPPGICFHFEKDTPDINCTIYPDYFTPLNSLSNQKSSCHCNVWISGCSCGAFKAEQKLPN